MLLTNVIHRLFISSAIEIPLRKQGIRTETDRRKLYLPTINHHFERAYRVSRIALARVHAAS